MWIQVDYEGEADPRVLAIIRNVIGELPLEVRENAEVMMANAENNRDLRSGKTCMGYPEKVLRTLTECVIT